ncbi:MAG: sigma-70 family RNA polymerase sigma factor [Verrucomicrobia bacterium]|nr:sigma-70 family RNA polymerase sigma factor [Verrucomicrobiota bacterium]
MRTMTDNQLLEVWAERRSDPAFSELVRRYLDVVHSAALRQVGDAPLADDVAQAVFQVLARKAGSLRHTPALGGWLYRTTRLIAICTIRSDARRRRYEQEAAVMNPTPHALDSEESTWTQVAPLLDEAMAALPESDRNTLLLRFFQAKPMQAVGEHLGVSEEAAKKRVSRAVEKLRTYFARRGVTLSAAALTGAVAHNAVQAAPASLAATIAAQAGVASGRAAVLAAAALRQLLWAKLRLVFGWGAAALIVAATGVLLKPKPASPLPAFASSLAGGDSNTATQSSPRTAFFEKRQPRRFNANAPGPHGPELFFVDDNNGLPITNQVAALRGWDPGSQTLVERRVQLQDGGCVAPFDPNYGPNYLLLTCMDGYADTRLHWETRQGEEIPESYTVRLVRPAKISGRVLDPAGNPVAGAEVAIGSETIIKSHASPEVMRPPRITASSP